MKECHENGVWGDNLSRRELVLEIKLSQSYLKLGSVGAFLLVAVDSLAFRNRK